MSDRLREGDLEAIDRHISKHNRDVIKGHYPEKGRIVQDKQGRRVIYDVENGRPRIKAYENEDKSFDTP